ncbi:MAG: hypothetical protein PF795_04070 [Kiritimatiellae bacterium]|nr:hypothetical protein [Kiritimatiellia bacterium]
MRTTSKSSLLLHLFLALSMLCGTTLLAQDEEASVEEITQGQAAVLLVRRLGLWQDNGIVLTQNQAISRLENLNIAPLGGWDADEGLPVNEVARMLAQALQLDGEFSDAEKSDPDAKAHKEALIAQYNLDVDDLVQQLARNRVQFRSAVGRISDRIESDPLTKPNPSETDGFIPTEEEFTAILDVVTNVQSPTQNITPSAP